MCVVMEPRWTCEKTYVILFCQTEVKAEKDEERKGEDVENISLFPANIERYYKKYNEGQISSPFLDVFVPKNNTANKFFE